MILAQQIVVILNGAAFQREDQISFRGKLGCVFIVSVSKQKIVKISKIANYESL